CRLGQPAASANPGAVPPLPEKIRKDGSSDKAQNRTPQHHENAQVGALGEPSNRARPEVVVLERPEEAEVELGLMETHQDVRNQKGETQLEEHHRERAHNVIAAV